MQEIIKSSNFRKVGMLSMMTNTDIGEIIMDKKKELLDEKNILKRELYGYRGDNRKILELLSKDRQDELIKLIKTLDFELKQRDPITKKEFLSIDEIKSKFDILEFIEYITGETHKSGRRLIKCPFPDHNDSTSSFKIYNNTNSFYCYGCKRWGDIINFIEYYYGITRKEAIKKITNLFNK